ncbi:multidrug ABC transporter ATPase [Microbacterium sp.]|uniref:multidrug ABC transporter ATPase n=1 Tax=Microbacterium sp. TaxID=51671 RepID=UPI0033410F40
MSTQRNTPDVAVRWIDRFLAIGALVIVAASIICFFVVIAATASGMKKEDFSAGLWPLAGALPLFGLPIGFAMIIALLVMSFIRKGRAAKRG